MNTKLTPVSEKTRTASTRSQRLRWAMPALIGVAVLSLGAAGCSKDDDKDSVPDVAATEASIAASDASTAMSEAGAAVSMRALP
jgi:hypothetical protein